MDLWYNSVSPWHPQGNPCPQMPVLDLCKLVFWPEFHLRKWQYMHQMDSNWSIPHGLKIKWAWKEKREQGISKCIVNFCHFNFFFFYLDKDLLHNSGSLCHSQGNLTPQTTEQDLYNLGCDAVFHLHMLLNMTQIHSNRTTYHQLKKHACIFISCCML